MPEPTAYAVSRSDYLVDCICYARFLIDHGISKDKDMHRVLLGVRAENAVANRCGDASLKQQLAQMSSRKYEDFKQDFSYVNTYKNIDHRVDVKAKWQQDDQNLSNHRDLKVVYVFTYPADGSVSVEANVDLVFAIEGWCPGEMLDHAPARLIAPFWCPRGDAKPFKTLLGY
jgi:hypothetical protein